METHSRRKLLGAGIAGVIGTALRPVTGGASIEQDSGDQVKPWRPAGRKPTLSHWNDMVAVDKEIDELLLFWKRVKELPDPPPVDPSEVWFTLPTRRGKNAFDLPLYTASINRLPHLTPGEAELPEPQIPMIHATFLRGGFIGANFLTATCSRVAKKLALVPEEADVVDRIIGSDQLRPSRVMAARYVVDVEDPMINMRHTAMILMDSTVSIWNQWRYKVGSAIARVKEEAQKIGLHNARCEVDIELVVTPVTVDLNLTGGFLQNFQARNLGAGAAHVRVTGRGRRQVTHL